MPLTNGCLDIYSIFTTDFLKIDTAYFEFNCMVVTYFYISLIDSPLFRLPLNLVLILVVLNGFPTNGNFLSLTYDCKIFTSNIFMLLS